MALNELAGFPIMMVVGEDTINAKLKSIYDSSNDQFPGTPWKISAPKQFWTLTVDAFEAPEVDFDTTIKDGCRLKLKIKSGHYKTYKTVAGKDGGPPINKPVDYKLDGLTIILSTPTKKVKHDTWSDADFEVQAIFADLERCSLVEFSTSKDMEVVTIAGPNEALKTIIQGKITEMGKANPQALVFGAVKIPQNTNSAKPTNTLTPTSSRFSTYSEYEGDKYKTGNLHFLLMLDGNSPPSGNTVGQFNKNWLQSSSDATLVLSEGAILEKLYVPGLQAQYSSAGLNQQLSTIQFTVTEGSAVSGEAASAKLKPQNTIGDPSENSYNFRVYKMKEGKRTETSYWGGFTKFDITISQDEIKTSYYYFFTVDHWYDHNIACDYFGNSTTTISFDDSGNITSSADTPKGTYEANIPTGERVFGDIVTFGFDELGLSGTLDDGQSFTTAAISDGFKSASKGLTDLFLMPGKNVFDYASAKMDGQIKISLTYK